MPFEKRIVGSNDPRLDLSVQVLADAGFVAQETVDILLGKGINTLRDLAERLETDLLRIPGLAKRFVRKIKQGMAAFGQALWQAHPED